MWRGRITEALKGLIAPSGFSDLKVPAIRDRPVMDEALVEEGRREKVGRT